MKVIVEDLPRDLSDSQEPPIRQWVAAAVRLVDGSELETPRRDPDDWSDNGGAIALISSEHIDSLTPDGVDVAVIRQVASGVTPLGVDSETRDYLDYLLVDIDRPDESVGVIAGWLQRAVRLRA